MYKFTVSTRIPFGDSVRIDLETGKLSETGNLEIHAVEATDSVTEQQRLGIKMDLHGGGLAATAEEKMFQAPEGEYSPGREILGPARWPSEEGRFYAKTGSGKYAAIYILASPLPRRRDTSIYVVIYYNPSGSRNLRFDQKKLLNQ
ncbi:MAG TPA: hypothetical protein VHD32_12615 [Candidatus Didemnitutus sp.]|nr:hypothetical protein [Candidatus Didemnitutus sp.]